MTTTTNPLWEMRRGIRNFHFNQEQEVLDLMFTIAVKLSDTNAMSVAVRNRVIDKLDEICQELEEAIVEAEDAIQAARESGQMYIDEKNEHNPDRYL